MSRYGENAPMPAGTVMVATFTIEGLNFMAINGGPQFTFSPAISFVINCETQEEVDHLWDAFAAEGKPNRCGWIDDKYGITWQIVPDALGRLMGDPNRKKAVAVQQAMMQMGKLDANVLQEAYDRA